MNTGEKKKYMIRGTKEGLWFEVVKLKSDDLPELVQGGEVVAEFEVDYSSEKKKFVLKRILFKKNIPKEDKAMILADAKDFVETLNVPE